MIAGKKIQDNDDEKDNNEEDPNIGAKDRGSYSLLVKGAAQNSDWENAVKALEDMQTAGIYPESRCLNSWTEAMEGRRGGRSRDDWWDEE